MINLPGFIFSLVMGFLMSLSITCATTFVRVGRADTFFSVWFEVWSVAYPVAIICILIYRPIATRVTNTLLEKLSRSN
ncbi:DUF2798 domain-containing protein [Polynucleobacter asymbioticus]|jgi:hypothetical protein|uniref:DUF2798 domain-containing protein n=1 Tax=Polynucleobacter asymbioticus TaxID=576611 RepID=A0AAC9IT11_9BURK|nr:DUF2798 domain-containing protein [Polynucleobacter asymbioticus]APB99914.1 hypothetical protein A4F89_11495 [Polynucleobacter asymbioticus]APC02209.1 hypothetical protein AOC25_11580 [Polynucleobacter asymbioticus]